MMMRNPNYFKAITAVLVMSSGLAIASGLNTERIENSTSLDGSPISDAILAVSEDVKLYNEHLTTLASPYMMGRVPGSEGMERARDYCAFTLAQAGLEPAFPSADGTPFASFYDTFELGGSWNATEEKLMLNGVSLQADEDFVYTGLGTDGSVSESMVFVGYSIDNGPDGFDSFNGIEDLEGKIAVMFRFEPVDENGEAKWGDGSWSGRASFNNKLRAINERGAAGAIIINPPGTFDRRANRMSRFATGGGGADFPVFMMTPEAGERFVSTAGFGSKTLLELREHADAGGEIISSMKKVSLVGASERESIQAANVGGILRGSGALEDEWIVVGAHLDHLGMGYFGSRTGPGKLHPGADDNASGSAGVLLLADKLSEMVNEDQGDRRSILLMLFDGEESGLNGSRHYVNDPIVDIENHAMMFNWDMIGRIEDEKLVVSGLDTGAGMRDFFTPLFDDAGLQINAPERMSGASDHTVFYRANIPVVFSHIDGLHSDYHTPEDTSDKINRVGATKAVHLFAEMVGSYASYPTRFEYASQSNQQASRPMGQVKVRLGIMPGSYSEDEPGIPVGEVTAGGSADEGGILAGDRIVRWDGQKLADIQSWMELLAKHEPGDEVKVGVSRDGEEITLDVTLQAR
ncbi:MAG: M28 family peptidase [Phycisphaerales bacterium]